VHAVATRKPQDGYDADVILAASSASKDMLYATGFHAGDPFLFFRIGWRTYLVASDLEIGRARKVSKVRHVLPLTKYKKRLEKRGVEHPNLADILAEILTEKRVKRARVPHDFPIYAADKLRKAKIRVKPEMPPFWPERVTKTEEEIGHIRSAVRRTEAAIRAGVDLIRRSTPRRGKLFLDGEVLTSEKVRTAIHVALMELGMTAEHTIVAGGEQAVDPHNEGSGPLRSSWPIILDVFPRCDETGYHGDITRTVLRGRPKPEHKRMWEAVHEAQAVGCASIRAGVNGSEVHEAVQSVFEEHGFETGPANGGMQGFFHGTGHGLGLDVHEPPRVSSIPDDLEEGMVVTVEPGLYYPGLGGIRIEDDVVVRTDHAENLVDLEKDFVV
jgi:Xaa-Pro aminopeptidase